MAKEKFVGEPITRQTRVIVFNQKKPIGQRKVFDGPLSELVLEDVILSVIEQDGTTHYGPYKTIHIPDDGNIWKVNI